MNSKALVVLLIVVAALPFIVLSVASEIRKSHIIVVLLTLLALISLDQFSTGRIFLLWLGNINHLMIPFMVAILVIVVWVVWTVVGSHRSRRDLSWTRRPKQSEFAWACIGHLLRNGWRDRGHLDIVGAHGFWTSRGKETITFFFCVDDVPVNAIKGGLKTHRRPTFPDVRVVTWGARPESLLKALNDMDWDTIDLSVFRIYTGETDNDPHCAHQSLTTKL